MNASNLTSDPFPAIVVDKDSLIMGDSGSVTGIIYWRAEDHAFPDHIWNDFVIVVLRWWIQEAIGLAENPDQQAVLRFVDGPFEVRISRSFEHLTYEFLDRHPPDKMCVSSHG